MDESLSTPTESKLPLFLAGFAFVLAVLAVLFSWSTRNHATDAGKLATELNARLESSGDNAKIAELERTVRELSAALNAVGQSQRDFEAKTQGGFSDAFNKYREMGTLIERLARGQGGNVGGGTGRSNAGTTAPGGTVTSGEYTVVAGDTLSGIAPKVGVTLAALEAANPGVDSTRLRIGQKLKVPGR